MKKMKRKVRGAKTGEAGASGPQRAKASFAAIRTPQHTTHPKAESIAAGTNSNSGPDNRADSELKHMMRYRPSGMKQISRRQK